MTLLNASGMVMPWAGARYLRALFFAAAMRKSATLALLAACTCVVSLPAQADSQALPGEEVVVFGPKTYQRGNGSNPVIVNETVTVPAGLTGPFRLKFQNGDDGNDKVSAGSVSLNGLQIVGPNDFTRSRSFTVNVQLAPTNALQINLAGKGNRGRIALTLYGTRPLPIPVAIAPLNLQLAENATGTLSIHLQPAPPKAGSLSIRTGNRDGDDDDDDDDEDSVVEVASSISFAAGQTEVLIPVKARNRGNTSVRVTLNKRSVEARVRVVRQPLIVSELTPASLDLIQGSTGTLKVKLSAIPRSDTEVRLTSAQPAVASVPTSVTVKAGRRDATVSVSALSTGQAQILAELNGSSATASIRVRTQDARLVSLLPAASGLALGAQTNLRLTLTAEQPAATTVQLAATPPGILDVPAQIIVPAGEIGADVPVTAAGLGTANITAHLNGSSTAAAVQVSPPLPRIVSLLPSPLTLRQGADSQLTATLNAVQLGATPVTVTNSNTSVVAVPAAAIVPAGQLSADIPVSGLNVGQARVSAKAGEGAAQEAVLNVVPLAPIPLSLLPNPAPVQQGATAQLILTLNAAQLEDLPVALAASASGFVQLPAQVTVPAGAVSVVVPVVALAVGSVDVIASIEGQSTRATLDISPPPPTIASVEPAALSLPKGAVGQLLVKLTRMPAAATTIALASSNNSVVEAPSSVTVAAGVQEVLVPLVARAEGVADISASLNSGQVASRVTVTAPELVSLTLSPQAPLVFVTETLAFVASGTYTDGTVKDVTAQTTWSSSAPAVASIASTGVLSALAAGLTTVTASAPASGAGQAPAIIGSTLVTVDSTAILSLSPASANLKLDDTLTLTVGSSTPAGSGGLAVTLSASGSGSVTAPAQVLIPAGQTAATVQITGKTLGNITLTATAQGRLPATAQFMVVPRLEIATLTPATGPVGIPVAIGGMGFDPNPVGNDVRFNGERAVVAAATATRLDVIVPVKALTGPVTVTTSQGSVQSAAPFVVQMQQDFDVSLLPASLQAPAGTKTAARIKLDNKGLLPYAYAASLSITGLPAGVTAALERASIFSGGESTLTLTVPANIAPGNYPITVQASGQTDAGVLSRVKILNVEVPVPGATTVTGRVLHAEDDGPFVGARVRLNGQAVLTDAAGYYRFNNPGVTGEQIVQIDASAANTAATRYAGAIAMPVLITNGKDNPVLTSYISAVDATKFATVTPGVETSVTVPELPNYSLNIPQGAILYGWDGTPVTQISVRTIPVDRLPIKPVPAGVETRSVYLYYFFREGGANPTQPIPVTMINDLDAVPGEKVDLWYYDESIDPDPTSNQWKIMGKGTVSADGRSIVSDPGVGIPRFCCGASFAQKNPSSSSNSNTGSNGGDGNDDDDEEEKPDDCDEQPKSDKPVDLATGNNLPFELRSFGIAGFNPVNISCRYRSTDPRIGPYGRGTSWPYDWSAVVLGSAVQVTNPSGVKYLLPRDADGVYRATTGKSRALGWEVRTTASGRTLRFPKGSELDFNSVGNLIAKRDSNGRQIRLTLDGNGFVSGITDANNRSYAIARTNYTSGQIYPLITSVTDTLGRVVKFAYDGSGRLATYTDANNAVTRFDYDGSHRVTKRTDPRGGVITFQYDSAGRTTKETLEDGSSTIQYAYTTVGNLVTQTNMTDPLGRVTEYRFNGQGYETRRTDALGRVTHKTRDPATNLLKAITDPAGRTTKYEHDAKGNIVKTTDPLGNVTRVEYDPLWNKPTKITDALGRVTRMAYDGKGNLSQVTDAAGKVSTIAYNLYSLPETLTDVLGRTTSLGYDSEGNLTWATDSLGRTSRMRYDDANRLTETTDPLGATETRVYDALNRITQRTDANGNTVTLGYDTQDRLTSFTDARNNPVERRTYNLRGFLTQTLDAANKATTYQYDAAGNLTQVTDRKGQVTRYSYDALNRITRIEDGDGRTTTYDYDLAGNVARISDNQSGDLILSYDTLDRLTQVISDQGTIAYQYDAIGRRTQRTVNGGDPIAYSYDALDRLTKITYRGKDSKWAYDDAGRLLKKTLPNGMTQEYSWDDADQLQKIDIKRADNSLLETVAYQYDAAGRRIQKSATVTGVPETPLDATYDAANRLTGLTLNGQQYTVTYDSNGNLTSKQAANGNTITYTWNARNQLTGISGKHGDGTQVSASFKYDPLGRRIEKVVNGNAVQYLYDGKNAIAELRGNAIDANILTGLQMDEVIARYTSQGERALLTDALGSVILAAKENGQVQTAYGYSPYGETQVMGTEEGNPSQYTARENDGTGLYYYRARYYDPQLKRWIAEDPIGLAGGTNLKMYVEGDPVNYIDPEGLFLGTTLGGMQRGMTLADATATGSMGNAAMATGAAGAPIAVGAAAAGFGYTRLPAAIKRIPSLAKGLQDDALPPPTPPEPALQPPPAISQPGIPRPPPKPPTCSSK